MKTKIKNPAIPVAEAYPNHKTRDRCELILQTSVDGMVVYESVTAYPDIDAANRAVDEFMALLGPDNKDGVDTTPPRPSKMYGSLKWGRIRYTDGTVIEARIRAYTDDSTGNLWA